MSQVKTGAVLSFVYTILHIIVTLLYVPILLRGIGQSEYGLYQIVGSVIAYISITQTLLSAGVLKYYCQYKDTNNERMMENTLAIAKRIYYFFSVVVIIVGAVLYIVFPVFYKTSLLAEEIKEAQKMIILLSVNIIINLTNYVYTAAITANEKFIFLKIVEILSTIFQPITIILCIRRVPYAITVVFVQVIFNFLVSVVRKVYCTKKLKIKIVYHGRDRQLVRNILFFSLWVFFAALADQIFWKIDQILLGKIYGAAIVAIYAVGAQIYTNYMTVGVSVSGVFMPKISQVYNTKKDLHEISDIFIKVGRISFMLCAAIMFGFIFYGKEFIELWAGKDYEVAYYIALIVMVPFTIDIIQNIGLTVLQVINKYSFRGKMYLIIAVINVVFTLFMTKAWGMVGAASATAISMFIGNGLIMNVYYAKVAGLDIKRFWIEIFKIIPSLIIVCAFGILIKFIVLGNSWHTFILHIVLFVVAYIPTLYFMATNKYEKALMKSFIKRLTIKIKKDV